ncbi:cytidine deaminase [uncultured Polaribacter sp.]|uniref:cytidine deaminase n=1 Tax=uncultured Polaribacter sp. TaxID=174711 RepID=UPI0026139F03|nr:cytidine deaminase [uncultured Polaribacter sp.]
MKEIKIATTVKVFKDIEELATADKNLMQQAILARKKAYAPYSKFNVGAALLLANGKIITGNNQENAAYPSGLCAERVAVYYAGAQYPGVKINKLAISASSNITRVDKPVGPCGACRQALAEYEITQKQPFPILFTGEVGEVIKTNSLADLLPFSFDSAYLE